MNPIILSYGGGTQSTAIACLIADGKLPRPDRIVIADTGREATETWDYLDKYTRPLLRKVGIQIEIAAHDFATVDLYSGNGDLLIPAYTSAGMLQGFCSNEWKKRVIGRWLRAEGFGPTNPVTTWLGISVDEVGRAKPSGVEWQTYAWPLLDLRIRRQECVTIVERAGLPTPPRSACWMCPYRSDKEWSHLRENWPDDFEKAAELDAEITANDQHEGVFLHRSRQPLSTIRFGAEEPQLGLFGEVSHCDSGMCWV